MPAKRLPRRRRVRSTLGMVWAAAGVRRFLPLHRKNLAVSSHRWRTFPLRAPSCSCVRRCRKSTSWPSTATWRSPARPRFCSGGESGASGVYSLRGACGRARKAERLATVAGQLPRSWGAAVSGFLTEKPLMSKVAGLVYLAQRGAVNTLGPAVTTLNAASGQRDHAGAGSTAAVLNQEAIHSVLQQTFEAFEIVVVDDGSTDQTCEVVSRIRDSRIRLMRQNRQGASAARIAGAAASSRPIPRLSGQ